VLLQYAKGIEVPLSLALRCVMPGWALHCKPQAKGQPPQADEMLSGAWCWQLTVLAHLQQVPHQANANHAVAAAHATLHSKNMQHVDRRVSTNHRECMQH
jgi:hypothetical protein